MIMKNTDRAVQRASTDSLWRVSALYEKVTWSLLGATTLCFLAGIWLSPRWLATMLLPVTAWVLVWKSHERIIDELELRSSVEE